VFKELLSCVEDPQDETPSFNGSVGATSETQSGFFAGSRYTGGKPCTLVPYRTTNTITSGGGVTVNGYTLGANSALISYALPNPEDSILLAHTITFAPVWSNNQGLFDPARIKYCKKLPSGITDCTPSSTSTPNPNLLVAQGCSSPAIAFASIPDTEPGCVRAWATEIVASSRCASPAPSGGNRTCMLVSIDVLEGKDPPWGITE
jgi:hypothetical protein